MGTYIVQWFLIGIIVTFIYGLADPSEFEYDDGESGVIVAIIAAVVWPYTAAMLMRRVIHLLTPGRKS